MLDRSIVLFYRYLYTKITGFLLWLTFSFLIYLTTIEGMYFQVTALEVFTYMVGAQLLGLVMTLTIPFIPRVVLRIPIAFGLFNEKH